MQNYVTIEQYAKENSIDVYFVNFCAKNRDSNGLESDGTFKKTLGKLEIKQSTPPDHLKSMVDLAEKTKIIERVKKILSTGEKTFAIIFNRFGRAIYLTRSDLEKIIEEMAKNGTIEKLVKETKQHGEVTYFKIK